MDGKKLAGFIHLHDLLKEGIVWKLQKDFHKILWLPFFTRLFTHQLTKWTKIYS
jgi:hypothetical protein